MTVVTAAMTKSLPFGGLVHYANVSGPARGVEGGGEPGAELELRVLEFDAAQRRFSAELA
ncbi:hypothetical protein [Microbacterium deminutum]|uniref:Uncharacterized protein n=1 Tax=Microbacterium deminutum TaxID=344164 RepID=A0ABN2QAS9_9MICO